ncbi:hypothetical protein L195_g062568 [Trifolium pratense]|uniref:RNase H type-1 domain-containing protein n=1 Tax=Trifolium pratense TaxID=57577 RepID=A0A2K3KGH5_TRIPR|nr:hypothetical protein L195_g062568 [Trifolium pratense]
MASSADSAQCRFRARYNNASRNGEAVALLAAIQEVADRGITNVVFETDSKNVVDSIRHQ